MDAFVLLPSGKIVNTAQVLMILPEEDRRLMGSPEPRLGRFVHMTRDPEGWWLNKADADFLVLSLGVRDWTTS